MAEKKTNVAAAAESTVIPAFGTQHIKVIEDRLNEIQGKIYLAANLAHLIAPDSDEDIEMHTVLCHISDVLQNIASDVGPEVIIPYVERMKEGANTKGASAQV